MGVEPWEFDGDSGILRERRLNTIGVVAQDARVVAVDWHQVTDTWRLNRREASRADEETADLPKQVLEFYSVVRSYLRPQDKLVILSHIERSERNKRFLLRAVNHCQLPVDLVLITQNRVGNGGESAVLQALLGYQSISRACLLDDNIQVLSELVSFSGLALHVKTQRRETWDGRSEWNISLHWPVVRFFLSNRCKFLVAGSH